MNIFKKFFSDNLPTQRKDGSSYMSEEINNKIETDKQLAKRKKLIGHDNVAYGHSALSSYPLMWQFS